ncbi:MAG: DUF1887 family CARF protein [Amphritea sp.]
MMSKAHICMVSDQPLANILPTLVPELKPDTVYLLTSEQQRQKGNGEAQKNVFSHLGITAEIIPIGSAFNLEEVQKVVQQLIDSHPQQQLLLNATGGTKPMSIAAYELCYSADIRVFYLQSEQIIWLNPLQDESMSLSQSLSLSDYLNAHDIEVTDYVTNKVPQARSELAGIWAKRARKHSQPYARLNYYAQQASNDRLTATLDAKDNKGNGLSVILDELERLQMLQQQAAQITFADEDARFFANGGWLEEWLFSELMQLKQKYPTITSVARSVSVELHNQQTQQPVRNELDVIAIVNNRLWVFECKTKRMQGKHQPRGENEAQHMIYKLAGLMKSLGGLRTCGCVVSFNALSDYDKARAELFDIGTIDGRNLAELRSQLAQLLGLRAHASHQ